MRKPKALPPHLRAKRVSFDVEDQVLRSQLEIENPNLSRANQENEENATSISVPASLLDQSDLVGLINVAKTGNMDDYEAFMNHAQAMV